VKSSGGVLRSSTDMDEYDKMLQEARERADNRQDNSQTSLLTKVPSLLLLCIRVIADHIDAVESLGELSVEVKTAIIAELAARRKLTGSALSLVMRGLRDDSGEEGVYVDSAGVTSLTIPDCSTLNEEDLVGALARICPGVSGGDGDGLDEEGWTLDLLNCGHCFTSWAANRLSDRKEILGSLEVLRLGGLYRITDKDLSSFLSALGSGSSKRLHSLSLTHSSVVGELTMQTVPRSFPCLRALSLDYCALDGDALEALCSFLALPCSATDPYLAMLTALSLCGIEGLTDDHVERILSPARLASSSSSSSRSVPLASRLQSLSFKQSHALTDASLQSIRAHCVALQHLDLSGLCFLTNEGVMELFQPVSCHHI
jgi:hypothetical protein